MSTDKPHLIRIDNQESRTLDRKLVIGRHPGCDYVLTLNDRNIGISGRHASIEAEGEIAWVEDLGSTNGTWVQGERIGKRTRLTPGDRFQLDRLEFEFRGAVKPVPAPAPAPPPPPPPVPRAPTTVSIALEDLALPAPRPLKPESVRTLPPRPKPEPLAAPPPPPPPKPPEPPPVAEVAPPVLSKPAEPQPLPRTVEVQVLEEKVAPPPRVEPVAAPPPPPKPEPARSEAPKPATDNKPQKVSGGWVSADHGGKTKVMMPEERARLREQMGSGLYGALETVSVPTLLFLEPEERRVTLAQRDISTQDWTIGSNADADVSIPLDGLSGLHAKIRRTGQTWTISDLFSANGTFVNGEKTSISHLESGNQLGFGPVLCTFLLPEGAAAPLAPKPAPAGKPARGPVALPLPLLLGGALLGLALIGAVIYLLLRKG